LKDDAMELVDRLSLRPVQFGQEIALTEHAHAPALGYDDGNDPEMLRDRCPSNMPAAETERNVHTLGGDIQVSARRDDSAIFRDDECPVELRELLDGSPQAWVADVGISRWMPPERIQNQRSRARQDPIGVANREQRSQSATVVLVARDLLGQRER
jgi:hypothetical protein